MKFLKDFGAVVALLLAAAGGLVAWGSMSSDVKAQGTRIDKLEPDVAQNKTDNAVIRSMLGDMKDALDRPEDHAGTKRR